MSTSLAPGYTLRRPTHDDVAAVQALTAACDLEDFGEAEGYSEDELRDDWATIDLDHDAWITMAPSGEVVGYAWVRDREHVRVDTEIYVHPHHQEKGIGTTLVHATEERAREHIPLAPSGAEVVLHNWINGKNQRACALLEQEGYEPVRYFLRMETRLTEPPLPATFPEGITIRTFQSGDEAVFHQIAEETMADHWGHVPQSLEPWTARFIGSTFDPSLWFMAMGDDEPVGIALCSIVGEVGWVDILGIRAPWRKQGLGMALLRHAFCEFHHRGLQRVALGVDAGSPTGATRLYERAGMKFAQMHTTYGKVLRPGADTPS